MNYYLKLIQGFVFVSVNLPEEKKKNTPPYIKKQEHWHTSDTQYNLFPVRV